MPKIKVKCQTVKTGECTQTNGRYQKYYRPCYAVDNYHQQQVVYCSRDWVQVNWFQVQVKKSVSTDIQILSVHVRSPYSLTRHL